MLKKIYKNFLLKYPLSIGLILTILIILLSFNLKNLKIDASSESLLLENDTSLDFTRQINEKYATNDFLVITFTPKDDLFSENSLNTIKELTNDILRLKDVKNINSILNVPLLQSPKVEISNLSNGVLTLEKIKENNEFNEERKNLIKKEFLNSPLYKNNLVSNDFKTTAIVINLKEDDVFLNLIKERKQLFNDKSKEKEKEKITEKIKKQIEVSNENNKILIEKIRTIITKHQIDNNMFLGGVSMISNDIIQFIKNDISIYGLGLLFIMILVLYYLFRNFLWVFITFIITFLSVVLSSSIIASLNMGVTVISSNFISLQIILTTSIIVHLIIRYQELVEKYPKVKNQKRILLNVLLSKSIPTLFAVLTTIIGFLSLVISGILPIINLGIMMSLSIVVSLILSFIYFGILLAKFERIENVKNLKIWTPINISKNIIIHNPKLIIFGSLLIIIFSVAGSMKLIVENSFINYFKKNTEIYKSMYLIDQKLGGTTPLDVIVNLNTKNVKIEEKQENNNDDGFSDEFSEENSDEAYWFTSEKMDKINKIHNYLNSLSEVGYVQSFSTVLQVGKDLNDGKDLKSLELGVLYNKLPEEYKKILLYPYVDIENNQLRFTMRIKDSNDELRRNELLIKIEKDINKIVSHTDEVKLSNLMLLYNNMLQSLFDSQIKTLGVVLAFILAMFIILFRNMKLSFIAIISNIIPIGLIFGFMGIFNIPLDIMTITIASISIGIGIDDAIHYIHRYESEFAKDKNYTNAMVRTHKALGSAMYFTTLIIMLGFSILVFSNLIPTIYFGLLTMFTMFVCLVSSIVLLPRLLIILKPFGKQH